MTVDVIDLFKIIDIQKNEYILLIAASLLKRLADMLLQRAAV